MDFGQTVVGVVFVPSEDFDPRKRTPVPARQCSAHLVHLLPLKHLDHEGYELGCGARPPSSIDKCWAVVGLASGPVAQEYS